MSIEILERGSVTTSGDYSAGVIAQSIGGGGGAGGSSKSGSINLSGETQIQLNSVIGGNGGWAGGGGNVVVLNTGNISTGEQHLLRSDGRFSPGLFAQSIGGGGGMGGSAYNGTITVAGESESGLGSIDGGVVVGGRGGAGGDAGSVEIKSMGEKITTKADFSSGIQAVSVGGGGGTGGSARSKSSNYGTAANNLSVVLGGDEVVVEMEKSDYKRASSRQEEETKRAEDNTHLESWAICWRWWWLWRKQLDRQHQHRKLMNPRKKGYTIDVNLGGKAGKGGSVEMFVSTLSPLISTTGHFAAGTRPINWWRGWSRW